MEIKGKIVKVLPLESGVGKQSGKEWKRATLIVEYGEGQYPKQVAISNMKNADAFAALSVGTTGTFLIEPTSREYNGRYYTSVDCWKWEVGLPQSQTQPAKASQATSFAQSQSENDLPF